MRWIFKICMQYSITRGFHKCICFFREAQKAVCVIFCCHWKVTPLLSLPDTNPCLPSDRRWTGSPVLSGWLHAKSERAEVVGGKVLCQMHRVAWRQRKPKIWIYSSDLSPIHSLRSFLGRLPWRRIALDVTVPSVVMATCRAANFARAWIALQCQGSTSLSAHNHH